MNVAVAVVCLGIVVAFLVAAIATTRWMHRRREAPRNGSAVVDDLEARQRQALEINDNIVQGLYVAQTALALEERDMAEEAIRSTLTAARKLISELLGETGGGGQLQSPAVLLRRRPAFSSEERL